MKLFCALGPGDIVAAHRAQRTGKTVISETSIIFSGQLLEFCRERKIETLAISSNPRTDRLRDGIINVENRPRRWRTAGGIRFHVTKISYAIYLALRALWFRADLAIIDSGSAHYFALTAFKLFEIPVAVNFHNTIWPNGHKPEKLVARLVLALDGWFFRRIAVATAGVSPECGRQVRELAQRSLPFFEYRAQFRTSGFQLRRKGNDRSPFRVVFVGRIEQNKGVLDVAAIAERVRGRSMLPIIFEICGEGDALPELQRIVQGRDLNKVVLIHGRLTRPALLEIYARAHAVIVPTRSDFCEGLPMVCAEAVLSGVPIITSHLSNAIPVLGPALLETEPENIDSYVEAIMKLAQDHLLYEKLSDACPQLARQFLDRSQSYPAAIDRLIANVLPTHTLLNDYEPIFAKIN